MARISALSEVSTAYMHTMAISDTVEVVHINERVLGQLHPDREHADSGLVVCGPAMRRSLP